MYAIKHTYSRNTHTHKRKQFVVIFHNNFPCDQIFSEETGKNSLNKIPKRKIEG